MLNQFNFCTFAYKEIIKIGKKISSHVEKEKFFTNSLFSKSSYSRRLAQIMLFHSMFDMLNELSGQLRSQKELSLANFKNKDFSLRESGKVFVTLRTWCGLFFRFLLHWIYLIVYFIIYGFIGKTRGPFSILDSNLDVMIDQASFEEYCLTGNLSLLKGDDLLFIKSNLSDDNESKKLIYCQRPFLKAIRYYRYSFFDFLYFLILHFKSFFIICCLNIKYPFTVTLNRDFVYFALVKLFDKDHHLKNFIRTNSEYGFQELWLDENYQKNFTFNIIWYSINTKEYPFKYEYSKLDDIVEFPNYYFISCDTSWTWNEDHKEWLQAVCPAMDVKVVGPILFRPFDNRKGSSSNNKSCKKNIAIFDITPYEEEYIRGLFFGIGYNYLSLKNSCDFLEDIISVNKGTGNKYSIKLKPKRYYTEKNSKDYIDFIREHRKKNNIELIEWKTNIKEMMAQSDLVICFPFTSPAFIAEDMNKKVIYYDPTGIIWHEKYLRKSKVPFISGIEDLKAYLN